MGKKVKKVTTVTEEIFELNEPKNNVTHIICVLDRSGSMVSIIDDMIGGFNTFIEEQKNLDDECYITIVLFDHAYNVLHEMVNVKDVNLLTKEDWVPRGTTALYDAIGKTINDVIASDKISSKKMVCIVTDGYENSSVEFKQTQIKDLIHKKEKESWKFVYLGANQDAFSVGGSLGVSKGNIMNFASDSDSVMYTNSILSRSVKNYRSVSSKNNLDNMISDAEKNIK